MSQTLLKFVFTSPIRRMLGSKVLQLLMCGMSGTKMLGKKLRSTKLLRAWEALSEKWTRTVTLSYLPTLRVCEHHRRKLPLAILLGAGGDNGWTFGFFLFYSQEDPVFQASINGLLVNFLPFGAILPALNFLRFPLLLNFFIFI